jgi:serine/threonine protein kinase
MPDHPKNIDRYEVQEVVGRGAMGVVYRALDPVIGRIVALKTIHLNDAVSGPLREDSQIRFAREARAAGLLSHPNIVTVYDIGEIDEGAYSYIAMEFVEGRTLRQVAPHGHRLPQETVLDMAMQIARALDYAHRRGVVHRDVKPANILVREDGLLKLADFGVARIDSSELTRTGQSIGSPSYIAPEMLLEQPVDGRADLFSLGVILYELLTGEKPFRGDTIAALYHQVIAVAPRPPSERNGEIPREWDDIVLKLLAKSPQRRYASASKLIEDLRCLEVGRPLNNAQDPDETRPELVLELPTLDTEDVPEALLERVILEHEEDVSAVTQTTGGTSFPLQMKALMALLTIAGFALVVIIGASFLRGPSTTRPALENEAAAPAAPAEVDMTLRFAHNLKDGRLTLTMDGKPLLSESFHGERSRMRMQGALSRHVPILAGKHMFRVVVQDDGGRVWNASSLRDVPDVPDTTLFVELKGFVKKSLDLTWY